MNLVVFAHVPPPPHGQSQMVQHLVEGFRRRPELGIRVLHIDARLSSDLSDVGSRRWDKVPRLVGYCLRAIGKRLLAAARFLALLPPLASSREDA